ncbi:MAG: helix-hairpin-helix domain-containing protein, partial [Myxococcota bacterium]
MTRGVWVVVFVALYTLELQARPFGGELTVRSTADLNEYDGRGELEPGDLESLGELLEQPVDLNRADASRLYDLPWLTWSQARAVIRARQAHGIFSSWEEFRDAGVLSLQLCDRLRPFVTFGRVPLSMARVRTGVLLRQQEAAPSAPQSYLQLRARGLGRYEAGALLTRRRGVDIDFDPSVFPGGSYLSRRPPGERPRLESAFVSGRLGPMKWILGSYTAGFGTRLTFNSSLRRRPAGIYENQSMTQDPTRASIRPLDRQFGLAAQLPGLELGHESKLDVSLFLSSNSLDLYQGHFSYGGAIDSECSADQKSTGSAPVTLFRCARADGASGRRRSESQDFVEDGRLRAQR